MCANARCSGIGEGGGPDPHCRTQLGAPRGQTLRGGTRGPPLIVAQLPRALPRKPGFCQVQEQLLARGAGECRRPTPQGRGKFAGCRPQSRVRGLNQRPRGSLTLRVLTTPQSPGNQEGRLRYLFLVASASNSYSQFLAWAPGLCPRPEHSVLLCLRHTRSHTYTLRRGGAYTSPQPLQPAQSTAGPPLGLWLLGPLVCWGHSCVWWIHCRFPISRLLHSPSSSLYVPLATLTCLVTQPSTHLLWGGGSPASFVCSP